MKPERCLIWFCAIVLVLTPSVRGAAGDEHWAATFGGPGPSNNVFALAVRGDHVYTSGYVIGPGGPIWTNNWIETWDGLRWSALPGVFTGTMPIYDSVFVGNDLYVCGFFSRIDGATAKGVARWNGVNWTPVGEVRGLASTLATDGANLYMGGIFTNVSGVAATNIAKWNGLSWSGLGDGLGVDANATLASHVDSLLWKDRALYAGGLFTNSGGQAIRNLASWNGANWGSVGGDVDGLVSALAAGGANLYAGGNFNTVGGVSARGVAKWDGANWLPLGSGVIGNGTGPFASPVSSIGVVGTNVIVGGSLTNAGGMRVSRIARWDGSAWNAMGALNDVVQRIRISGTNAYIGGLFTQADDYIVNHLTRWDGTRFQALGRAGRSEGSVFAGLRTLAAGNGRVYAGGLFTGIGRVQASRIACWDGSNWSALGSGVKGTNTGTGTAVNAIAVSATGEVYAGGSFTNAGGVSANNIARWNGSAWSALGGGIPGSVFALAVRGSEVFAGGNFTMNWGGFETAFHVAKWNGSSWTNLPGATFFGTIGNFFVSALAVQGSDLYVGGSFVAGGFSGGVSSNIVRHTGADWAAMALGVSSNVNAIAITGSDVYVGGRFPSAGNVAASRIARWNGSSWADVGGGVSGTGSFSVSALAAIGSDLYAGGSFTNAGGVDANKIARWNGSSWSALGSGVSRNVGSPSVLALTTQGSDLFAGGNFEAAGGKPAFYIAQWNETQDFDFVPSLQLSNPSKTPGGSFHFNLLAAGVPSYMVEASSNLVNWVPIATNTSMAPAIDDPRAVALPYRFYRARSGPP